MESMYYGPRRRITEVGEHRADGTTITLECSHTWTLVPHMHMDDRSIGQTHPCSTCRLERTPEIFPVGTVVQVAAPQGSSFDGQCGQVERTHEDTSTHFVRLFLGGSVLPFGRGELRAPKAG